MIKLMPFQKLGVQKIEKFNGRVLLADEMGLGKTAQTLAYIKNHPEIRPIVIVCPCSVKYVWEDQAKSHFHLRTTVCNGQKAPRGSLLPKRDIYIINYDILLYWAMYLRKLHPQLVVLDECHNIKSRGIARTRAVRNLCSPIRRLSIKACQKVPPAMGPAKENDWIRFKDTDGTKQMGIVSSTKGDTLTIKTQIPHLMALSGTPLTNRPSELWTVLNLLWPREYPAFTSYAWEFCKPQITPYGWKFDGANHLPRLHQELRDLGMIRRLKKDVLKELPSKQRFVVPLDMGNVKDYREAQNNFLHWLRSKNATKAAKARKAEQITQLAYLRRLAAEGKIKQVIDWIDNFLKGSEDKLVVGCIHHSVIDALHQHYKRTSVTFTGKTPARLRQSVIKSFQHNPAIRIIIGQIKAIGTGVDGLQRVANTMAVLELPWDPGTLSQLDDRIHRIGQNSNVSIYYLVSKGTIEERLCQILQKKQNIVTKVLDGDARMRELRMDIFDQLSKELKKGKVYENEKT